MSNDILKELKEAVAEQTLIKEDLKAVYRPFDGGEDKIIEVDDRYDFSDVPTADDNKDWIYSDIEVKEDDEILPLEEVYDIADNDTAIERFDDMLNDNSPDWATPNHTASFVMSRLDPIMYSLAFDDWISNMIDKGEVPPFADEWVAQ